MPPLRTDKATGRDGFSSDEHGGMLSFLLECLASDVCNFIMIGFMEFWAGYQIAAVFAFDPFNNIQGIEKIRKCGWFEYSSFAQAEPY